jgi:hypothetical protein
MKIHLEFGYFLESRLLSTLFVLMEHIFMRFLSILEFVLYSNFTWVC